MKLSRSRKGRILTPEESALWRKATQTVLPLQGRRKAGLEVVHVPISTDRSDGDQLNPPASETSLIRPRPIPDLAPMQLRTKRRLSRNRQRVDASLDLHGHTEDSAHKAVVEFVFDRRQEGAKLLLIITGKGRASPGAGGVLRRCVPGWLRSAELRSAVLSIEEAAPVHGGAGALYVMLRRERAASD